jgi:CHAT domain-containing protein
LPAGPTEAAEVAAALPGARAIQGAGATPAMLDRAAASSAVFHFIGHAILSRDGAALLCSPDPLDPDAERQQGVWRIRPDTRFSARLAFFSACSTAAYEENNSIAPGQLALAALSAGAEFVVASLWDVDSEATHRFAGFFYRALNSGASPEEAAHQASRALRSDARYAHPYFWAPFAVYRSLISGEKL